MAIIEALGFKVGETAVVVDDGVWKMVYLSLDGGPGCEVEFVMRYEDVVDLVKYMTEVVNDFDPELLAGESG